MKIRKVQKLAAKMDRLGVLAFLYVIIYSALSLSNGWNLLTVILLIVGIGGFLVDSFIVIKNR
jgi:hypothetical protein